MILTPTIGYGRSSRNTEEVSVIPIRDKWIILPWMVAILREGHHLRIQNGGGNDVNGILYTCDFSNKRHTR